MINRVRKCFPLCIAAVLAGFFVLSQPGLLVKDAGQYDALATSLLRNHTYTLEGRPTMYREPGYPMFRAVVRFAVDRPAAVLWVQAALFVFMGWLVREAIRMLDPSFSEVGAWAVAFSYGLAVYAARHLLELLTAFLLALAVFLAYRCLERATRWWMYLGFGFTIAVLALTRANFLPVGLVLASAVIIQNVRGERGGTVWRRIALVLFPIVVLLGGWVTRNTVSVGTIGFSGRSGPILLARALKSQESWQMYGSSMISVIAGQATVIQLLPQTPPIIVQHWKGIWEREALWRMEGLTDDRIDARFRQEAIQILQRDGHLIHFLSWTVIDELRLFAMPSPGTPDFSIEGMFLPAARAGSLGVFKQLIVLGFHFAQLLWWIGLLVGLVIGFRRYGGRFFPGIILLATVLVHAPTDNIIRYGVPLHPWIWVCIFLAASELTLFLKARIFSNTQG